MGRMGQDSDSKTQLVLEICAISKRSVLCVHRFLPENSPFIDWYCILGVEEKAGIDSIRKRYHKLALQLHPDKNKHPKAEIAFKLVSEAYTCLSDNTKRKAFNLERWKQFCYECNKIPYTSCNAPSISTGSSFKVWKIISRARSYKIWRNIKDVRERFKEEAKVIENCLRTNSMSRRESPLFSPADYLHKSKSQQQGVEKEIPVFNPSDYIYKGYPHLRNHGCKNFETLRYLQTGNILAHEKGGARDHSPVFQVRSDRRMFTSNFASVPS
ncbi:hypothetical protein L6164_016651 [Bauhinia variegata]|uniref:Uncharacterized protein n=1 Tax=Bauhinia variegata TaxID=167791 RepID=A0ACB9NQ62_BAUVA|nr:hypothetical protein L6164_016651 [Bauhinia variegata]